MAIMKFDFYTRNLHIYETKYRLILKNLNHHYKFVETLDKANKLDTNVFGVIMTKIKILPLL